MALMRITNCASEKQLSVPVPVYALTLITSLSLKAPLAKVYEVTDCGVEGGSG